MSVHPSFCQSVHICQFVSRFKVYVWSVSLSYVYRVSPLFQLMSGFQVEAQSSVCLSACMSNVYRISPLLQLMSGFQVEAQSSVCLSACMSNVYRVSPLFQLVSGFQVEAQSRQQEADTSKAKLSSIRKMISKLLKSINEVSQCIQAEFLINVPVQIF